MGCELDGLLFDDQAADVEVVQPDDAFGVALVAVRYLPCAFGVLPTAALCRVEDGVLAVFDFFGEQGALHPCVGGASVEVQFDALWWRADADFCNVQGVVFDVLSLDS